jgi:hypothetical protein
MDDLIRSAGLQLSVIETRYLGPEADDLYVSEPGNA